MSFSNHLEKLNEFRAGKAIIVWKRGNLDEKTGRLYTRSPFSSERIWWLKGKIVVPDKIMTPRKEGKSAENGLYFDTQKPDELASFDDEDLIKARVQPKDIIAANFDGTTICAVAAKIIDAPNPNQKWQRIEYLKKQLAGSGVIIQQRDLKSQEWAEEREDYLEAQQQIADELRKKNR